MSHLLTDVLFSSLEGSNTGTNLLESILTAIENGLETTRVSEQFRLHIDSEVDVAHSKNANDETYSDGSTSEIGGDAFFLDEVCESIRCNEDIFFIV